MITYEARDPATVEPPPAGKYRFFCTEDGNFARMDSEGNVSVLPFSADIPDEYDLPTNIVKRRILSSFLDGSEIGRNNTFSDGATTLKAMGLAITRNANGTCLEFPLGDGTTYKVQSGIRGSGSDGYSSNYDFPVPFTSTYTEISMLATKQQVNASAVDGNSISAKAVSLTQFVIGSDDYGGPWACGWSASGI